MTQRSTTLPIELSEASGVPRYRQLEEQIAELVRAGRLVPGSRLPSVRELAASLLVSLITVRRAYADLEAAGIIVSRQGQGTFVADGAAAVSETRALEEAREVLREAFLKARQMGLEGKALRSCVNTLLNESAAAGATKGRKS